ncbi:acetyl/propionyl-CoA carboxylase alpha subunit [Cryobacterium sp. MP_M5]|uniref:ATP-binding protein n=1 Tax=unclassified Cryobacterium TaxID=2649013 RepID=UPI0018C93159|nr:MULTISPECIES: biotin carboxylase N-terminal domain-containing protein [unclassified Cryobacterium]MBG6057433.1 acetyl-CoA/propionyl-CoA carboxylase biotin carboxyl carrier protein [Cryobacterium sp. MP_M3]MEC5175632.1 acetyl/propionyl-CoA carboxylase alpha subunit [Cryobacterium sp. MP_M5]
MTTFDTVLVANRGEIACRIIRTLRRLGIRSVAVYSDADRGARHVGLADVAVRLGPARAQLSYLDQGAVLAAAAATGAQAIHPGYGFLSENQDFAQACAAAGVVFIGPSVHALTVMGDKIRSKNHVADSGVRVIPGVSLPGQTDEQLAAAAPNVGYPMLIKPSAGGGGKGMVRVDRPDDLAAALVTARRVAAAAFGDDTLLIERFVSTPRHIEVQVLADTHGGVIHLGERECSLQRRHQKVIEEAPSPLLDDATRARIGEAACAAARSVGYAGAGTVEFLVSDEAPGEFFFMEMNTRLQVEHPVTEMITGIDLVEWQVRVAAGERLGHRQEDVVLTGHAIEARVYAENPERGFLPTTGTVLALKEATGEGIRVDSALTAGLVVSADYDPMLAKVIAWAPDRAGALARLDRALAGTLVLGLRTNVEYLRLLVQDADVNAGRLDTGLIERKLPGLAFRAADDHVLAAAALFLHRAAWAVPPGADLAWSRPTGWRMGPHVPTRYVLATNATESVTVTVEGTPGGASVSIDGRPALPATLSPALRPEEAFGVEVGGVLRMLSIAEADNADGPRLWIGVDGSSFDLVHRTGAEILADELAGLGQVAGAAGPDVRTPMPGTVVAVHTESGALVAVGQAILTVEAMKMEHQLTAATAGIVTLTLKPGDLVRLDQIVATVTAAPDSGAPGPDTATVNADKGAPQ